MAAPHHHALIIMLPATHAALVMHAHLLRAAAFRAVTAVRAVVSAVSAGFARRRLVSVVTPTWRRRTLLTGRCIPSVQGQTYSPAEHIIVSDGPDPSLTGIPGVTWLPEHVPERNRGLSARRAGTTLARGDLIAYLDDDNAWHPRHLEILAAALAETGAAFAYSRALYHGNGTAWLVGQDPPAYGQVDTSLLLHEASLLAVAGWEASDGPADWHLVSRWMAAGAKWVFVPEVTLDYWARLPVTPWTDSWRVHALAAIAEGLCPNSHGPLSAGAGGRSFRFEKPVWRPGGWCGQCAIWWHADGDEVTANYPVPGHFRDVTVL